MNTWGKRFAVSAPNRLTFGQGIFEQVLP